MRAALFAFITITLISVTLHGQEIKIIPTTTLSAETFNNTSAADTFVSQTNGNMGASNVSKVDIHSLLYPGANTKVIAHFMPWFGQKIHMNVGYNSQDPAQIHRQITDMISRGVNGIIIDWYGSKDYSDVTAKRVMAEIEQHPGFTFAIMVDKGALTLSACDGCTPQQTLIQQVQYVEQTYIPSPAYMQIGGRPMITNFDIDLHFDIDWDAVQAQTSTNPAFIFQHAKGFTHAVTSGSYSWVTTTTNDFGMSYLDKFYKAGLAAPQEETFGAAYKGFNDTLASWGLDRIMTQQCGQTWLETFTKLNSYYSDGTPLPELQLVTWNDYEEGTEIESGIDNCVTISSSLSDKTLQWTISGEESTIDHYVVYISTDGQNLMSLAVPGVGSRSLNLANYALETGTYTLYVQAAGKPTLKNQMSGPVQYTVDGETENPPPPPAEKATITLGASPSAMNATLTKPGISTVTVTPVSGSFSSAVALSCTGLPKDFSCLFAPPVVTPGSNAANSTLTISGPGTLRADMTHIPGRFRPGLNVLVATFSIMGLAISGVFSKAQVRRRSVWAIAFVLIGILTACGGGLSNVSKLDQPESPVGIFNVTIHGDAGDAHVTTPVTLTVN